MSQSVASWSVDEFIAWENRQATKNEFDGFAPVAMTGGTAAHAAIQRNLTVSLTNRLRGGSCQFFGSELKLRLGRTVRYPDGMIVCSAVARDATWVEDLVTVFEVISASTARTDKISKVREYLGASRIRRYVLVEQEFVGATELERGGEAWLARVLTGEDTLALPEAGISVPLAELYAGLDFADGAGDRLDAPER